MLLRCFSRHAEVSLVSAGWRPVRFVTSGGLFIPMVQGATWSQHAHAGFRDLTPSKTHWRFIGRIGALLTDGVSMPAKAPFKELNGFCETLQLKRPNTGVIMKGSIGELQAMPWPVSDLTERGPEKSAPSPIITPRMQELQLSPGTGETRPHYLYRRSDLYPPLNLARRKALPTAEGVQASR